MKIIVCVKAVPGLVSRLRVAKTQDKVEYESGSVVINEADEYALEAALTLKKELGGAVTVMTVGTLSAQQALYAGLARGADAAIRISTDLTDPAGISTALAEAVKTAGYDLVFTGMESSDNMAAQVGGSIAGRLGSPFAYGVVEIKPGERAGTVRVTKEVGGGVKQILEMSLPAVLAIQSGIVPLTSVSLRKVMEARSKPVQTLTLDGLRLSEKDLKEARKFKILSVFPPPQRSGAEVMEGEPSEMARRLSERIKEALR
ncbi:MAG: electron transfer flavoprotein subunit beta/FixA family protein [Chloroflexi bacterium]|nr:electron transfer flavoprotein subunit beta/FixA family protein [Chloroflexota bacterium]